MSYIFEHSCLATKPELDLFSTPPTQAAMEEGFHTEHMPTSSLSESNNCQLPMGLYAKDRPGHVDDLGADNTGLVTRRDITGVSQTVQLILKPHADIFFQKRLILNGVDLKLKLLRNSDSVVLMAAAGSTFKLKIENASFFC